MRILNITSALLNPAPAVPQRPTTASAILDTVADALNRDGATVEPGWIDSSGLTLVTCDGYRFRLELSGGEIEDWSDYQRRLDGRFPRLADPAGFNGMVDPDEIPF